MDVKVDGKKLIITIPDVSAKGNPSSSGKTLLVASTQGSMPIQHPTVQGLKLQLNLTVPNPDKPKS